MDDRDDTSGAPRWGTPRGIILEVGCNLTINVGCKVGILW